MSGVDAQKIDKTTEISGLIEAAIIKERRSFEDKLAVEKKSFEDNLEVIKKELKSAQDTNTQTYNELEKIKKSKNNNAPVLGSEHGIEIKSFNESLSSIFDKNANQAFSTIENYNGTRNPRNANYNEQLAKVYSSAGEIKSILRTDQNVYGGFANPLPTNWGERDINVLVESPILNFVNIESAGIKTEGTYDAFDFSAIDIFNNTELTPVQKTELLKASQIKITLNEYSVQFPLSNTIYHAINNNELRYNPYLKILQGLDGVRRRKYQKQVLIGTGENEMLGILTQASKVGTKLSNQVYTSATSNIFKLDDIRGMESKLKSPYLSSARTALFVSRDLLIEMRKQIGTDGHLLEEYFEVVNGQLRFKLATVGSVPVFVIENGLGLDYVLNNPANAYSGKIVAILGDLSMAYTIAQSGVVEVGIDTSLGNALNNGFRIAGQFSYAGGRPVVEEAIALGKIKA